MLLHPLRSELNFPIGHKATPALPLFLGALTPSLQAPIDLGASRWDLPLFLIDALIAVDDIGRKGANPKPYSALASKATLPVTPLDPSFFS